ncbi:MAG: ABC transporter permease [Bacteroidales bacterium]|nr:ABC transporter permease [Bacteroidales bacterium]
MFRNYLLSTLRQVKKHRLFFLINVLSLSIGIATVVLISLYIHFELSFDKEVKDYKHIYRVCWETTLNNVERKVPASPAPLCASFIKEFPEVVNGVRLYNNNESIVVLGKESFKERNFYFADSTFFEMFSVPIISSLESKLLTKPNTLVLTENTAFKLFGDETAIGKNISLDGEMDFEVVGICKNFPANYHLDIDYIASISSLPKSQATGWQNNPFQTYLLLRSDASIDDLQSKIPELVKIHMGAFIQRVMNMSFDEFIGGGSNYNYSLQGLKDIHLRSDMTEDAAKRTSMSNIYIFMIIALLILILAIVNYVNLSTAKGIERGKEIGIRKIVGASRKKIIKQYLGESIFITMLSTICGMMLVEIALPFINSLFGRTFSVSYFDNLVVLPSLLILVLGLGLLSGLYPAFVLSSSSPLLALNKELVINNKRTDFRSMLIIFQYVISFILIIATIVVFEQLNYLRDQKLGFDKEQVLVLKNADVIGESIFTFKEELMKESYVSKVSLSSSIPGQGYFSSFVYRDGDSEEDIVSPLIFPVDHDFIDCYDLEIIQGRNFDSNIRTDSMALIMNQAAVDVYGLKDPLNEAYFSSGGAQFGSFPVIGVVDNFHFESLHESIKPCFITVAPFGRNRFITIKLNSDDIAGAVKGIKSKWESFVDNKLFEYYFIDQYFDSLYKQEELLQRIFTIFSILSIFIASIGLFGIVLLMTGRRTKEIGIRKVLGASHKTILKLFISQYLQWIGISVIIGAPIAWWATNKWLQQFAYRINFQFWYLLVAFILLIIVTLITVYIRIMKVSKQNPVDALRYE